MKEGKKMKKTIQLIASFMLLLSLTACGKKTDTTTVVVTTGGGSESEVTEVPVEILGMELYERHELRDMKMNDYHIKVKNITSENVEGYLHFQIQDKDGVILKESFAIVPELEPDQAALVEFQLNTVNGYELDDVYLLNFNEWQPIIDGVLKPNVKFATPYKVVVSEIPEK